MNSSEKIRLNGDLRGEERRLWLRNTLDEAWNSGAGRIEIDLGEVNSIDFEGLTELMKFRNRVRQSGSEIALLAVSDRIRRICQAFRIPLAPD